jgi:tripartite-type tricarboxylate transporter receptor subunit TctC
MTQPTFPSRRRALGGICGLAGLGIAAAIAPRTARAQAFPTKPIKVLVPYSPGGGADVNARLVTQYMGNILGQTFVVENRAGASGMIAGQATVNAPADGYTMLYDTFPFAVNAAARKMPYNPLKDLAPVSQALNMPNILLVPVEAPYKTIKEFITYAQANPGKLSFASYGAGGTAHLAGELLRNEAHIDWLHVPYKGGAPAVTDLLAGQVSAFFGNPISGLPFVKAGKLRALAVTSRKRMEVLPDVPTMIESGFKDFEVVEWNGFFLPAATPQPIIAKLAATVHQAVLMPEVSKTMLGKGIEPVGNTPEEFARFLQGQVARWGALMKANNITLD